MTFSPAPAREAPRPRQHGLRPESGRRRDIVVKDNARKLPLGKRRIEALLKKTEANGCTRGEAEAALEKAKELVAKYELDPCSFRWPVASSTASTQRYPWRKVI